MDSYTQLLMEKACALDPADDDYTQELQAVAALFRRFDEAMDAFLLQHGYAGDIADAQGKAAFLRQRLEAAGVPVPRGIAGWFTKQRGIERDTAFGLCFAFGLDAAQTNEFFRTVCFERGFDCHTVREAVYYFCISRGRGYAEAAALLQAAPADAQGVLGSTDVLYTGTIMARLDAISSPEELLCYLRENAGQFRYNNATATRYIRALWDEIAGPQGLAWREGQLRVPAVTAADELVAADADGDSVWNVYAQILGLDRGQTAQRYAARTIRPALADSILPPLAEACFPDRDGIGKVLSGAHVSSERVRKLMILLVFYAFWARKAAARGTAVNPAGYGDAERCLCTLDRYLLDAGYPALYAGNPYDWIFLWAAQDSDPLQAFRDFMVALFAEKYGRADATR